MIRKSNQSKPTTFRVYAGPRENAGLYVTARIFATKRDMLQAINGEASKLECTRLGRETQGLMRSYKVISRVNRGKWRTSPCIGTVSLYRRMMGTEVVMHEFAHAMFAYAERMKLAAGITDRNMAIEEQACYALGRMARRFVDRAYKLGLYSK